MNNHLLEMSVERQPLLTNLSDEEKKAYTTGLKMLAIAVCEDFIDLPELSSHKYDRNGLFYSIPYFNDETLWTQDNQRTILVVYEIKNRSSFCPLRIDFKYIVKEKTVDYWLYVYDQTGERSVKWELVASENNENYTTIHEYETIKLSELVGYKRKVSE